MKTKFMIFGLIFFCLINSSIALTYEDVTDCFTIPNVDNVYYTLINDIESSGSSCIVLSNMFSVENITIDCKNHLISTSDFYTSIINMASHPVENVKNIKIKNCKIHHGIIGINCYHTDFLTLENNVIFDVEKGISWGSLCDNGNIISNRIHNFSRAGINISGTNDITNFSGNKIHANYDSYCLDSDSSSLPNFRIYNNHFLALNESYYVGNKEGDFGNSKFNTSLQFGDRVFGYGDYIGGNYWSNWNQDGFSDTCPDVNQNGICNYEYKVYAPNPVFTDFIDYLPLSDYGVGSDKFHNITFKFIDSEGFFPITGVNFTVDDIYSNEEYRNYSDISNLDGEVSIIMQEGHNIYYSISESNYNTQKNLIFECDVTNWTVTIYMNWNDTFNDLFITVRDITTGKNISSVSVGITGIDNNYFDYTNDSGIAYFPYIQKGFIDISFEKTGYNPYIKHDYEITTNQHYFLCNMLNTTLWNVSYYNITVNVTDNNSLPMEGVIIESMNLDNGYNDYDYSNSQGYCFIENFYEGRYRLTLSKNGYDTLFYSSTLNNNHNIPLTMIPTPIIYPVGVSLFDKITSGVITKAKVTLWLQNCSGDYYPAYVRNSNMWGYTEYDSIDEGRKFKISINHSQYPYTLSDTYSKKGKMELEFHLSNLFHTFPVYVWIWNTTGAILRDSNIIVLQNGEKIREESLIGNSIIFNLKSDEKYTFTVSHSDYHSKSETIQNLNKIERLDINLTKSDQINPDNPLNLRSYGWIDFFSFMSVYGFPLFIIMLIVFVYRTLTIKDKG